MSSFRSLREKYGDFFAPSYQIKADGKELSREVFPIREISVDLGIGETCNACRFSVTNIYERGSRSIAPNVLEALKPGTLLGISLGYASKLTPVFFGYTASTGLSFAGDSLTLTVQGLDARGLMRENVRNAVYPDRSMEEVAREILEKYAKLIGSADISLEPLENQAHITQKEDDLSFLLEAAAFRGAQLYMEHDKLVINKPSDTVCVEFEWEEFDMDFTLSYLHESVVGRGFDPMEGKGFKAIAAAAQKAMQGEAAETEYERSLPAEYGGESAKKIIQALAEASVRKAKGGTISCFGIPEAVLGEKVKINQFPFTALKAGDCFSVCQVHHKIHVGGSFTTTIGLEG